MPILLAWLLAAGTQASGYRIAGTVVNSLTRQPVAGARVTIAPVEHPDQQIPFVTGPDGRFAFAGIPRGRYELAAQRPGFLTETFSGAIVAGPDQRTDAIVLPISPPGLIAGKVVDEAGEPVALALVQLFDSAIVRGRRRLVSFAVKQTADTGEYRFAALPPGTYYLAVSGYPWYTKFNQTHGDSPPRAITHTGYGIRYYPNVADAAAAEPLNLKAGQDATADFTLLPVPAATVQVHVEGGEDLAKQFKLAAAGLPGNRVLVRQGTEAGDLYNFWGIPPGHYTLRVRASDANRSWYATDSFDVGATDTDVNVALLRAPSLAGSIVLEAGGSLPPNLSLQLLDTESGGSQSVPIGADGKFAIPAMAPGQFGVTLAGPVEYYLKAWSAEDGHREGETLDIQESSAVRLKLWAAKGAGRVNGTVLRDGHPVAAALVVLADPANPENSRATRTGSDGSYEFTGVPPGAYALFGVADGADLEYADPAAIRPYLGSAQKLRVSPAGAYTNRLDL